MFLFCFFLKSANGETTTEEVQGWKTYNKNVNEILVSLVFKNVPLLTDTYEQRRLRSSATRPLTVQEIRRQSFSRNHIFLDKYIRRLEDYFVHGRYAWPNWLKLSEKLFLFTPSEDGTEPVDHNE